MAMTPSGMRQQALTKLAHLHVKRRLEYVQLARHHAEVHRIGKGRERDDGVEVESGRRDHV